jgi:hypothetical protein
MLIENNIGQHSDGDISPICHPSLTAWVHQADGWRNHIRHQKKAIFCRRISCPCVRFGLLTEPSLLRDEMAFIFHVWRCSHSEDFHQKE